MRDERWVNRFLFAWNDTLFYDPLDTHYRPRKDHFLSALDEEVRSRFVRGGIWWSHRLNPNLPSQGWKIHVSATQRNVHEVAATAIDYLVARRADFKIALDVNIFEMLNSKGMARGNSGKFITIYPRDDDEFRACLAELTLRLRDVEGAYVLSDMRYRDCKALYFRYGQFRDTHTVDAMGRQVPHIIAPDGPVTDERRAGFVQPWWLAWPFTDWKPDPEPDEIELLAGRFRVTDAIQFSSAGGVYLAEDTADGDRIVVLKEARPHTNVNIRRDHDAVDILAREWSFLNRLADTGRFPAPVATFRHWEHHFLAEEHVDAADIRTILFQHNPLVQPRFEAAQSQEFLRIFLAVFRGLAQAIHAAHERQVILGDLTATNLLIDPETFKVTVIDLESCRLNESEAADRHLQGPVELYTPGFSHSKRVNGASAMEGDLFSLAAIMSYFIFPVAAMSYLRDDVFGIYRLFIDRLGWPTRIHDLITDLAQARISLEDVLEILNGDTELLAPVDVPPRRAVAEESLGVAEMEAGVAGFITAVADVQRATLFPVDPFAHTTNPLSLGFGASGVLWALKSSGIELQPEWTTWLRDRVKNIDPAEYPAGLMNGLAGVAWAADSLGLRAEARELLTRANQRAEHYDDYTFYYGRAGLGMTNLHFYLRDRSEDDLAAAQECAKLLCDTAQRDGRQAYWLNSFTTDGPLTGLGFGQAGVALFLLRMHQVTGDEAYRRLGRDALDWEMANAQPWDGDSFTFKHKETLVPYVEVGAAGVAKVLLRYGDTDTARALLRGLAVDYTSMPGYGFGMCGIADTMLDAATILRDPGYRDTALRQLDYVRKVFLFEPAERFAVARQDGFTPLAVPGEGLLRCSCDLMTGSAGVLRLLHRVRVGGMADFLLDGI
ncbi:serine/threonine protein kinase [Rhizocola hellebori]|uniref:Serine/threonine protein kinase n=1 Tax=Rhizocola hellebori TaxID=1392758 RepID=A0A8J3QFN7_9ACTN|nr:class III lanthionine synthetase LanKC [Rhizocola hellebori]GIH10020.1 serine/threonine protein kinase [Rhizocola hellebori]